mgnify:CR=1 FL=1
MEDLEALLFPSLHVALQELQLRPRLLRRPDLVHVRAHQQHDAAGHEGGDDVQLLDDPLRALLAGLGEDEEEADEGAKEGGRRRGIFGRRGN